MDSSMIGKIQKARQYAEERHRIQFQALRVTFQGDHHRHGLSYEDGTWQCDCHYFASRGLCSHTMAVERILADMLTPAPVAPARAPEGVAE